MKNNYIRHAKDIKGKTTAFTEIIINASPGAVREKFIDFKKWGEWNPVIPSMSVKKGDINNLETNPTLALVLNFGRKNDPTLAPVNPKVNENNPEIFNWGFNWGILKAEHVHIFESQNDGETTRYIHYERMSGLLSGLVMRPAMKANMVDKYNAMNLGFKKYCEVVE